MTQPTTTTLGTTYRPAIPNNELVAADRMAAMILAAPKHKASAKSPNAGQEVVTLELTVGTANLIAYLLNKMANPQEIAL